MSNEIVYDTVECMKLIKKMYPFIPIWVIKKVLFAEELYMYQIGIIDWLPKLSNWNFKKV